MKKTLSFAMVLTILIPAFSIFAQGDLKALAEANAKMYMQPFITSFGMNMNSGLSHSAKAHSILGFDISVKAMFDVIPDEDKVFNFDISAVDWEYMGVTVPGTVLFTETELPTIFGGMGTITPDRDNVADHLNQELGTSLSGSDLPSEIDNLAITLAGVDLSTIPMFRPQISVGLPLKSELLVSYLPIPLGDLGDGTFQAYGLKHSLDQYIPMPTPFLNLSAQFVYQKFDLEVITSTHTNFNLQVSADVPMITAYALFGMDNSNLEASYTVDNPDSPLDGQEIGFELEGANGFRSTFGLTLKMMVFYLNVDYTLGEHNVLSIGSGLTLR